jgi:putative redox protein
MPNQSHLTLETVPEGLRMRARVDAGFETVVDSGQGRVAASPVETLLTAIGSCLAMDVISILRKKRQEVTGYEVIVNGDRRTEHPRSFTRIRVLHRVTGRGVSAAAVEDAVRLSVERYCSVYYTLDPAVPIDQTVEVLEG